MLAPATLMVSELIRLSFSRISVSYMGVTDTTTATADDVADEDIDGVEEKDLLDIAVYFMTPKAWWCNVGDKFALIDQSSTPYVRNLIIKHMEEASVISVVTKDGTIDFSRTAQSAMIDFPPEGNHSGNSFMCSFFFMAAPGNTLTDDAIAKGIRAIYGSSFDLECTYRMLTEAAGDVMTDEFKWPEDTDKDVEVAEAPNSEYRHLGYITYTRKGVDVHHGFGVDSQQKLDVTSRLPEIAAVLTKHLNPDTKTEAMYCGENRVTTTTTEHSVMISIDLDKDIALALSIDPTAPVILACIDDGTSLNLPVQMMAAHAHAYLTAENIFGTKDDVVKSEAYNTFLDVVKSAVDAM